MIRLLSLIFMAFAAPTFAAQETWPALYDVFDVAPDDVLNVRTGPDASTAVIGSLPYDAVKIEVVEVDEERRWGRVNVGEGSGWVALRFMERHPYWAGSFPPITACSGTEPFWDLDRSAEQTVLKYFGDVIEAVPETVNLTSLNRLDRFSMVIGNSSAFVLESSCTDGMSDRWFGLTVEVLTEIDGISAHMSGCCTIQPQN